MKRIAVLITILILALPGISLATEETDDCCQTINEIMDESAKEYREMSKTVMKEYIKEPETVNIEDCLAAINSISLDFSFSLPSLDQLLGMACDFVKGGIDSKLDEVSDQIENQFSFKAYGAGASGDVGVGTDGNNNVDFEVKDNSKEIVDSIWRSIQ
ncbi:MAG: hypothetical protein GY710_26665 [Desulfobacteraceae bacterium]|nr:hypothetical protein [Desulfobacteraceae bacterium]